MLQDYRNYIVNLRNSLIQNGVEISVNPISSYEDLFYVANDLSQILWFYSIMGIGGSPLSLEGFFIDINGYYKEKMRQRFYEEFKDYYDSYKGISKLAYLAGVDKSDNDKIIVDDDDVFDLFSEDNKYENSVVEDIKGTLLDDIEVLENIENSTRVSEDFEEVHGTFIDDYSLYEKIDKVLGTGCNPVGIGVSLNIESYDRSENISYTDNQEAEDIHGVFLDEMGSSEAHGILLDELEISSQSNNDEIRGTILDDLVSEVKEEVYDDIHYSDDSEDDVYDDIHYSEDEEEDVYDDIHYSEDEEDDVYDDIHYSEDDEEEVYDDIHYSEDEEGDVYDDIHYSEDDEEEVVKPAISNVVAPAKEKVVANGDMSDVIQNGVNSLLTKGKRFIIKEARKLGES